MAKSRWQMTHEQTEVGFEVLGVEKAEKVGYVKTTVEYPAADHSYTYIRKYSQEANGNYSTVVDGCKVEYTPYYTVVDVQRIYDTKGYKKQYNVGGAAKAGTTMLEKEFEQPSKQPKVLPSVPTNEIHHESYEAIKSCLECNIPVYLAGPAGSGKNYTVEQICRELNWDFYFSNSVQQEYKLTGFIDAGGKFHETEFYKACTSDNDCVFFLDEMDASIPEVLVLLNAAIANGYFEFPTGRVELTNVRFVAAGNTVGSGADEMYTGRTVLDQATLDRFAVIEFDYSTRIELAITHNNSDLVEFIHQLRKDAEDKGIRATFSYRCMTMVTKLEAAGMDLQLILKIAVVKGLDKDTVNTLGPVGDTKYHIAFKQVQAAA